MKTFLKQLDWTFLIVPIVLVGLGLLTFYAIGDTQFELGQRQLLFLFVGIGLFIIIAQSDYRIFKNSSTPAVVFYIITIVLLLLTLTTPEVRGARAWLTIAGVRFEPSELAKLASLILLAKYFSQRHVEIYRWPHILTSGIYIAIPAGITLWQSDFGSMMVFVGLWAAMLLFAGINKRHLIALGLIGVMVATVGWFTILQDYQQSRLISFLNPYVDPQGTGYNTIQSITTLGSGQLSGTFFDRSEIALSTLVPEPYTDFIFAAFAQQFGFVGIVLVFLLIMLLVIRIGKVGMEARNNFARLYCLGFITIIFIHLLINGGMNLGIMPITGIPFPFLSQGGSYLVTLMMGLGIVQSIKRVS